MEGRALVLKNNVTLHMSMIQDIMAEIFVRYVHEDDCDVEGGKRSGMKVCKKGQKSCDH